MDAGVVEPSYDKYRACVAYGSGTLRRTHNCPQMTCHVCTLPVHVPFQYADAHWTHVHLCVLTSLRICDRMCSKYLTRYHWQFEFARKQLISAGRGSLELPFLMWVSENERARLSIFNAAGGWVKTTQLLACLHALHA